MSRHPIRKTHHGANRPPFECIALLLQGGGALGAYQAGVYQALAEADLHPDCVAGISIGAINSAIIAGNPAAERVDKLRRFWETVSRSPLGIPDIGALKLSNDFQHQMLNQWRAFGILLWGAGALMVLPDPNFNSLHRARIVDHAEKSRLPAMYGARAFTTASSSTG
jgi:NTE family protein